MQADQTPEVVISKPISVVGAVIVDEGRVLCAQRGPGRALEGKWEFPGGKVEIGETEPAALRREISEELRCDIRVASKVATTVYEYDFGSISLTTYYCMLASGVPTLTEHEHLKWVKHERLGELDWAPADIPAARVVAQAELPR